MNYLLFFITSIFTSIFFIFYKLNILNEKSLENSYNNNVFSSLSGNLIVETITFGIFSVLFFIYFSNNSLKNKIELKIRKFFPKKNKKDDFIEGAEKNEYKNKKYNFFIFNISEEKKYIFRAISFIILYIFIITGIIFLYNTFGNLTNNIIKNLLVDIISINTLFFIFYLLLITFLFLSISINFSIHKKYQNYISLFFSILTFVFLFNFLFKVIFSISFFGIGNLDVIKNIFILNTSISFFIIFFTYLYRQEYLFDYTFLHFCSYIVNILGIIYFLLNYNFSFINLLIIITLFTLMLLFSYFKLKNSRLSVE